MAKNFVFSLQKVLDVKEQLEELQAIALRKAERILEKEKETLWQMKQIKAETLEKTAESEERPDLLRMKLVREYLNQLEQKIVQQLAGVQKARERVKNEREKLQQAVQEKMVIERLKERHQESYERMQQLREQKKLDEFANFSRKQF